MNNLRRMDLNLLLTLHVLLEERHVSRAAQRLHKSQPAVSHALAQLRSLFNDPLLVRRGGRFELTSRAVELYQPLVGMLEQLDALMGEPSFDPAGAQRTFRLAMSDYGAQVLLPGLVGTLRQQAPGVRLQISQASRASMLEGVNDGELDMALGVFPGLAENQSCMQTLFTERFACLADTSTLPESGGMDLRDWLLRPHILVAMRPGLESEIDQALGRRGLKRSIVVSLPHWGVAADLIAGTDLILTVARRSLDETRLDPRVRVFAPPLEMAPFDFSLIWHQRRNGDVAHRWLRRHIAHLTREGGGE